ncbi:MAG: hypothetical protein QM820_62980 [Minicystis sp.]
MVRSSLLLAVLSLAACAEPPAVNSVAPVSTAVAAVPAAAPTAAPVVSSTAVASVATPASAAPASAPAGSFTKLSPAEEQRLVTPHLAGKILAHPAYRGPFGPPGDNVVALTATSEAPPSELAGFVVLADGRVLPLPKMHDHWTLWEVHAVMFEDVDGDGSKELIVLAEYTTGAGPTAAVPFHANAVVRWDGRAFVRVPEVEKRIESLPDAAAIRKALRSAPRARSK